MNESSSSSSSSQTREGSRKNLSGGISCLRGDVNVHSTRCKYLFKLQYHTCFSQPTAFILGTTAAVTMAPGLRTSVPHFPWMDDVHK